MLTATASVHQRSEVEKRWEANILAQLATTQEPTAVLVPVFPVVQAREAQKTFRKCGANYFL